MKQKHLRYLLSFLLFALVIPITRAETLTVADGTSTDAYMPIYGSSWATQGASCQFIYPASELTNLPNGAIIKKIKFFASSNVDAKLGYSTTEIRLGNTESTTITKSAAAMAANRENMSLVFSGNLPTGSTEMEITCSSDFVYRSGQNLIVDTYVATSVSGGSYSQYWYVKSGYASGCIVEYNGASSVFNDNRLPKMEITYEPGVVNDYDASVSPNTVDFGNVNISSGVAKTLNVTLYNTGANAFTPSVNVTGNGFSTDFAPVSVASGQNITIPVSFNPTSVGNYTGTLTISCGNGINDFEIPLTGNAVKELTVAEPEGSTSSSYVPVYGYYFENAQHNQMIYPSEMLSSIVGKKINAITFHPSSTTNFYGGKIYVRLATTEQATFSTAAHISVAGDALGNVVPASGASELKITFDEGFVYPGGNLLVDIQTEAGNYGNSYTFKAISQSKASLYQYGSNSAVVYNYLPMATFGYDDASGVVTVNPNSLTFGGETFYAGQTEEKTFTVNNTTDAAVTITMTGDDAFTFTPETVAAGANETITVTYAPSAAGSHSATLTVGDKTVELAGSAQATEIVVSPAELSFGGTSFITGSSESKQITVTNNTLATITTTLALSGDGAAMFAVGENVEIAVGQSATINVTYNPTAAGTQTATLTVVEGKTVELTGTAVAPVISGTVSPATLNLSCQEGATTTGAVTVENTGNQPFTPEFSGIAAPFSIEAATEVAAGESKEFTVTYAPSAIGTDSGTLTVTINGEATNIALNGTATEAPEGGDLTVAESTSTSAANLSSIAPIYGGRYNTTGWVQMLYPASLLTDLTGKQITKVTFRHSGAPYFSGGAVEVKIGETENGSLSSSVAESTLTAVATVSPIGNAFDSEYYLTFEFSKPYVYNGGNLVIQTKVTTSGSESRSRFYGQTASQLGLGNITTLATSYSVQSGNGYSTSFLPQATFTYEKAKGVALVSPDDGIVNFGEVSVKGHKTINITVKNNNSVAVTPSASELAYPYSVTDVPASIAAGEEATIAVTMAPSEDTEDTDYNNVALTLTFDNGETMSITINGRSHVNQPTMTTAEFAEITYDWVDENEETHTSNLAEIATEPAQMVELMRKVYMTKEIPGNFYRGYTKAGEPDREVAYPAIGSIVYDAENAGYKWADSYGWNVGNDAANYPIQDNSNYNYKFFNPNEYKPNVDGITLLLVEMNDNQVDDDGNLVSEVVTGVANKPTSYDALCTMFGKIFKSVRVITESRRMGAGEDAGTIFKLNADKLNRFFLLAKGRLRMFSLDVDRQTGSYIDVSSTSNSYRETEEYGPFYQMFEQLSPVDLSTMEGVTDVYQDLVNMQSYDIHHDCQSIPFISSNDGTGHEFNMYGKESQSDDCQDVRDLMITIPARRMQWWYDGAGSDDSRDGSNTERDMNDMYKNYNKQYVPKMGLFVIKQHPITGDKQEDADVYDLNLTWTSNLLEFLPTGYGIYKLYRVVTNADGTKTYVKVADNLDPNTYSFVDHVPMEQTGQVVTYVVQGQDKEEFLSLQLSNEESFVIPGLDRAEQLRIALNSDYYYSRFDAATNMNNYSNSIIANNTVGTNVKPSYLENGSQFKFWRATVDEQSGEIVVPEEPFVVAEVSDYSQTTGGTLTYKEWKDQTDFSSKPYGHGYHANVATSTISINNGEVVFDGLKLYDNFSVSVEENSHPSQYVYYVTLETAEYFNLNDEGTETSNQARSNTVSVPIYKTGMTMTPLTQEDVNGDTEHEMPAATQFDVMARYSSKSEILGYYIYRWADSKTSADERSIYEDNGNDASPQGQAGNQATYYSVAMNSDYTGNTENFVSDENGNHPDVTATFMDNFMVNQAEVPDTYTYAPVVELFAPITAVNPDGSDRTDYNTYGGAQQMTAGGIADVSIGEAGGSSITWKAEGKTYTYYYVPVTVNSINVPEGYELYKVRVWRQAEKDLLGEQQADGARMGYEIDGGKMEYCFDELTYGTDEKCSVEAITNYDLGSEMVPNQQHSVFKGTFGALAVNGEGASISELPLTFVVRAYFTKVENLVPANVPSRGEGDDVAKYYIAESKIDYSIKAGDVLTGVADLNGSKQVKDVTYYSITGAASKQAFDGVNVVVTRYTDGTISTKKIVK